MKKNLFQLMAILTVVMLSVGFVSCSDDDENTDSIPIPSNLIGTWYKTSGATKHSMSFTFNEDGTGSGNASHNKIIWIDTWAFKYKCKQNGDIICDAITTHVDEDGESSGSRTLIFNYNGNTLTVVDLNNREDWKGAVFEK